MEQGWKSYNALFSPLSRELDRLHFKIGETLFKMFVYNKKFLIG